MDLQLERSVALVTGAGGGIGGAIAVALAREGCDVALLDAVHDAALDAVAAAVAGCGVHALALQADVRDFTAAAEAVARVVDQLGGLDILVCSAGITRDAVSWRLSESDWDDVLDVNLKGCFSYARAVAPVLRARGGGRVVLIGSINGLRGKFGQAGYAAAKAGLVGLGKTLARELGRYGVTVNIVAPGLVRTAMTRALPPEALAAAQEEAVLGGMTEPEAVADTVAFLCSARAGRITGEVIRVDAGQYI